MTVTWLKENVCLHFISKIDHLDRDGGREGGGGGGVGDFSKCEELAGVLAKGAETRGK